jgi:hypothetical protein
LAASGAGVSLPLYTGVFLMIGLPALWLWSVYYLVIGVQRKTLDPPAAILLGFLLLNITYVTAVANFLSSFENNRYRFPLDAFYVVLLGVMLTEISNLAHGLMRAAFRTPANTMNKNT